MTTAATPPSARQNATPPLPPGAGRGGKAPAKGFTLLELLVAMTMAAIIVGSLYSAMRIGFRAESSAEAAVEPVRTAELSMSLLRPDFESAVTPAVTTTAGVLSGAFTGIDGVGEGNTSADSVQFYTRGDPLEPLAPPPTAGAGIAGAGVGGLGIGGLGARASGARSSGSSSPNGPLTGIYPDFLPGAGEVRMVSLLVRPAATGNVLVRQVTTNLLSSNELPPYEEVVCRGVRSFNLRYFDGSTWQDSWDSTQLDNAAPTAVEVTIDLQRGDAEKPRVVRFTRVFLVSCSALWSTTTSGGTGQ